VEQNVITAPSQLAVWLGLTRGMSRAQSVDQIYATALDTLASGLGVLRSSILLFDGDGVMRFKAYRGLSEAYRQTVEGHTPWRPDSPDPEPLVVPDVRHDASLAPFARVIEAEGIAAMTFVPLVSGAKVIGKFMLYYDKPHALSAVELQLASVIASQVAFALERMRAEGQARRSEHRLRFALDAASMGTWDWNLTTQAVQWSENLERIHGLPPGTFNGTFASYEREIHPDDRERVLASARRAIAEGVPHEVEYRIVAPDGTVRWVEGKGQVEYDERGQPVRMTGVCMIVTRRKEAEVARLAAAEESSRLKDEFLATLSHELRTPLNAILGWTQMLQAGALAPERVRQAVDVIGRNAKLQAQLIEDILDISRIISGKLEIDRLPVVLTQLVDTVVGGALPAAQRKGIELVKVVPADLPLMEGDPKRLHQVLANLLSNAITFTPEGGRIEVRCSVQSEAIEISVKDSGVGIPREFLPYVFDRFRQADSRLTRKHGGLGLGLAIARHLVEQHRGTIRAQSDGIGRGTTMTVSLPIAPVPKTGVAIGQKAGGEADVHLRLNGSTVVIVDDQPDSRELLSALFEHWGGRVVLCESAAEALNALNRPPVHLLVADIAMPDIDGYELIRRVRTRSAGVPAIAVSAHARPQDRSRALASGYNGYCAKPIDASQLLQTVKDLVAF
jgi:PAS domain S-box-containing protein